MKNLTTVKIDCSLAPTTTTIIMIKGFINELRNCSVTRGFSIFMAVCIIAMITTIVVAKVSRPKESAQIEISINQ